MLYFPQLETGSSAQFPVIRRNVRRMVVNTFADGRDIRMPDDGGSLVSWDLSYTQLSQAECRRFEQLFEATYGRFLCFTFLDPSDNLLNWSEDLSKPVWKSDPLIQMGAGVADPFAGAGAVQLINTGQADQEIKQATAGPGSSQYCFSFYSRAPQPTPVEIFAIAPGGAMQTAWTADTGWTRAMYSFSGLSGDGLTVGIRLSPGSSVSCFGFQLEQQLGAGAYKKTRDRAGVYPVSRFDQDVLRPVATGVNQYSCDVRIVSNTAG